MANKNFLTLKALIAIIFLLMGLQYLSLLQVTDKRRGPRRASLFTVEWGEDEGRSRTGVKPLLKGINLWLSDFKENVGKAISLVIVNPHVNSSSSNSNSATGLTTANSSAGQAATSSADVEKPWCPLIPPGLHGSVQTVTENVPGNMEDIEAMFPHLKPGGRFAPEECRSLHKVAIIVPYRDREDHLRTFLLNIHPFLRRQQLDYGVYVIEQFGSGPFNRAMLMNAGAAEALKQYDYKCFIFHDVDLLPEDDRNLYNCPVQPRHMSVAINVFLYRLPYDDIFGGVSAMTVDQFREVNGFSNLFWGWGGEDDDMSNRLRQKKLYISRYPANIARYKMLRHTKDKANPDRFKYLYSGAKRMAKEGYNSLKYLRVKLELKKLYTWVVVDLPHLKL